LDDRPTENGRRKVKAYYLFVVDESLYTLGTERLASPANWKELPLEKVFSGHSSSQGESDMADKGSKDNGKKEERKKAKHTLKEKRKIKNEKKNIQSPITI
jgi:hypothetical protein